ncbi:MAG: TfoX/Sxy family protein [Fimbriimonadaceae bacterium]|nr:TfoX/Sxy family protein [Alphaproteobacteria bacterium]
MAANREFVKHVSDLLAPMGPLQDGVFFGGHAFKVDGAQFAMIMGNVLYLRVDDQSIVDYEASGSEPFSYSTRRGQVFVRSYYTVPDEVMEEPGKLVVWANRALAAARSGKKPSSRR